MVRISVLGDALKTMYNAEKRGKVRPAGAAAGCWSKGVRISCCRRAATPAWGPCTAVGSRTWCPEHFWTHQQSSEAAAARLEALQPFAAPRQQQQPHPDRRRGPAVLSCLCAAASIRQGHVSSWFGCQAAVAAQQCCTGVGNTGEQPAAWCVDPRAPSTMQQSADSRAARVHWVLVCNPLVPVLGGGHAGQDGSVCMD